MKSNSVSQLQLIPVFAKLGKKTIAEIAHLLTENRYAKDQPIFEEGDKADSMYILQSGEVEVRKQIQKKGNAYKTLAIFQAGDIFGEMALFSNEKRSTGVTATKDTVLWKLNFGHLSQFMKQKPSEASQIFEGIILILVERIRSMNNELTSLFELGRVIPSLNDLATLSKIIFEQVMQSIEQAKSGYMAILNPYNQEFDVYEASPPFQKKSIPFEDPICDWLIKQKTPYSTQSILAYPILHEEKLFGFILLINRKKSEIFKNHHRVLLHTICATAGERIAHIQRKNEDTLKERIHHNQTLVIC